MKNAQLQGLINEMKKVSSENKVNLWKRIASDLEKPTRRRRIVNLTRINKFALDNDNVIVPGKVLGNGELNKKLVIAAFSFSEVNEASNAAF